MTILLIIICDYYRGVRKGFQLSLSDWYKESRAKANVGYFSRRYDLKEINLLNAFYAFMQFSLALLHT